MKFIQIENMHGIFLNRIKYYWSLIKSLQTGLLVLTGCTGFISAKCPVINWQVLLGLIGSLFLSVSGSTILNMIYDKDIDSIMNRTKQRPLPMGKIALKEALILGLVLSFGGIYWAFWLAPVYGLVIFGGLFIDVVIYTIWLKRKTAWSIVWGGISGGMPILAGRVLATGHIDFIGILLGFAILLWIPTHIMTFNMRYFDDYKRAKIPTFPANYGYKYTQLIIAFSSIGMAVSFGLGAFALGLAWGYLRLLAVLSVGILGLAVFTIYKPSEKANFGLFKYASMYMLGTMLMIVMGMLK